MNFLLVGFWAIHLAWAPPTTNEDGSIIDDLAGFHVYQGVDTNSFQVVATLTNGVVAVPTLGHNYQIQIDPGTNEAWFAATAFDFAGNESIKSVPIHWFDATPGPPKVSVTISVQQ